MLGDGLNAVVYLDYICIIQIIFQIGSDIGIYKASQLFLGDDLDL